VKIGDLVKVMGRDVQEYGIITDIIEIGSLARWIMVMKFDGTERQYHPTRIQVLNEDRRFS